MTLHRPDPASTCLVVIDMQERLAAAMPEQARTRCIESTRQLVLGAAALQVPVIATEQYPRGLGPTVPAVAEPLEQARATRIEKLQFDVCDNDAFARALGEHEVDTVVVAGMEAHICVWQSARGLLAGGKRVHVATDAISSRHAAHHAVAEGLLRDAGACVTCTETVLFDWLRAAGGASFKTISRLVR